MSTARAKREGGRVELFQARVKGRPGLKVTQCMAHTEREREARSAWSNLDSTSLVAADRKTSS